ncbi:Tn3 family transposase [Nostoc sp.]|uniref:Tn3 family transposase n=1 Tax=Nostoc sp. TaxID=1180 RepID=UPI003594500B
MFPAIRASIVLSASRASTVVNTTDAAPFHRAQDGIALYWDEISIRTETVYKHIDSLFKDVIDWYKIQTHWQDILLVVLSIKTGKISSAVLLRK